MSDKLKNIDETTKEIVTLPRKTLAELINETDASIYYTLKNSIYPGARDESIAMVIAACKARDYPVLSKCYHIVPMSVKNAQTGQNEWRDVIMPGIALYRIEADRSKTYIGLSEPVFGPMIKEKLGNKEIEYPEWCKIIASKTLANGDRADFPAIEYWKENYATKGKDAPMEPNAMWSKRPRAQLAKCTEAQALRRAFPDILGSNVTFEEMEDKHMIKDVYDSVPLIPMLGAPEETVTPEQVETLRGWIVDSQSDEVKLCNLYGVAELRQLSVTKYNKAIAQIKTKMAKAAKVAELAALAKNKSQENLAKEPVQDSTVDEFFAEADKVDTETGEVIQ